MLLVLNHTAIERATSNLQKALYKVLFPYVSGYTLPKGSSFVLPAMILHRDPEIFPDPDKFDPDRFSAENSVNIPEYAYIPFSVGPRNCIGEKLISFFKKLQSFCPILKYMKVCY
ncbi:UNVERIFIED_CONTAM: Cyp3a16 [Trichonephila clavipes]